MLSFKRVGNKISCGRFLQIYGAEYIEIGNNFKGGDNLRLECWDSYINSAKRYNPQLIIGNNVTFTSDTQISCIDKIVIGDNCLFGRYVYISDNTHGKNDYSDLDIPPIERELSSKGPVIIGKNVWIGRCSTILSGITIGDNAIIGANTVVNKDVPAHSIVAGVPAKIIKIIK
jgi:acetyltransferase-like isoleucine patch superfamily enzyme